MPQGEDDLAQANPAPIRPEDGRQLHGEGRDGCTSLGVANVLAGGTVLHSHKLQEGTVAIRPSTLEVFTTHQDEPQRAGFLVSSASPGYRLLPPPPALQ